MKDPTTILQEKVEGLTPPMQPKCVKFIRFVGNSERIGRKALRKGLINHQQLGDALARQRQLGQEGKHRLLGQVFLDDKMISANKLEEITQ